MGMVKVVDDPAYDLNVYIKKLTGQLAKFWSSPIFYYNDHLTIDPDWFLDDVKHYTMFHELSHSQATDDKTTNDYNNAGLIETLLTTDLEEWSLFRNEKTAARKKCTKP